MDAISEEKQNIIRIGTDRVTLNENEVVIEAKHETADWEIRTNNTPAVYFRDQKYFLAEKTAAAPPFKIRYVLKPWPAGKIQNPRVSFDYGKDSVADRDSARRGEAFDEFVGFCLLPLYPVLGLFWSGMQEWLRRFGFIPRTITGLSIFTTFAVILMEGVFVAVTINASLRSGHLMVGGIIRALMSHDVLHLGPVSIPVYVFDGLLALSCVMDICIRYTRYLREDQWSAGFLQWLLPKSLGGK